MIALGIPGDGVTAALIGGLMLKGLSPGPLFTIRHPDVMYSIFNSLFMSSFIMLILMLGIGVRVFPRILRLPKHIILPLVLIMAVVGSYNTNISANDVWVSIVMGFLGYLFNKFEYPKIPVILTMILGTSFEQQLRMGLFNHGSITPMFTRPFSLLFLFISLLTIGATLLSWNKSRRRRLAAETAQKQEGA
jgi:putative tricarboxylic transport membrane protein